MANLIFQANTVTNARYLLSATQKNILYRILDSFQEDLILIQDAEKKGDAEEVDRLSDLLYREQYLSFKIAEFDKNRNYDFLMKSAKDMMSKPVEYKIKRGDKNSHIISNLISAVEHKENSEYIEFSIPKHAMPFLFYLKNGFTTYQKVIAISLRSKWSKRIYEICARWKDKGGYKIELSELREMLSLGNQYKQIGEFKSKILNVAQKEMKESADIWFEYKLEKIDSRSYNWITFKIYKSTENEEVAVKAINKEKKSSMYIKTYNFLLQTYPNMFDTKAQEITERLETSGDLQKACTRFMQIHNEKEDKTERIKLTKFILKEDYGII
ncbi:hypothetical protein BZG02_20460 [Labilibaculum filiforme]|uniref:Initiator Rep protein WH1 domain-containing protein n=1 Tax=Labilibaculum filiforme TaxID=1940526 RepID=A0A2N3HQ49_9BACT|nr:replication initiation protein [Labilibaculum filiforme]PKQ60184.1 hypothetical protein BZG02_20460 [Labilibaculum filiforme]